MPDTAVSPLTVFALMFAALATVAIGIYGVRLARTTSDFLVASRSVGPRWNAAAISGEYLSAASFLGVAGLIAKYGADALWYPIGFTAGYLGLLLFVAAPLRRSGAYTVPDFAEFRLGSRRVRTLAMLVVAVICTLYLIPQFQGAGLTLQILLGVPSWVGAVAVCAIVIANVAGGGMRSITFVQAFQYWLKLTAVAIPALVLGAHFLGDEHEMSAPTSPTVSTRTTVDITTDVVVQVAEPEQVTVQGTVDGQPVEGPVTLAAGEHELAAGTQDGARAGGGGSGGVRRSRRRCIVGAARRRVRRRAPALPGYSLILATFLGTMGLPHVLVRFYTNPDGRTARRDVAGGDRPARRVLPVPDPARGASRGCTCRSC